MTDFSVVLVVAIIFVGMPWLFLHYSTQLKRARGLTPEDEKLLDQLHDTARKLDDRLNSIERIMNADNPNWREERFAAPSAEPVIERRH